MRTQGRVGASYQFRLWIFKEQAKKLEEVNKDKLERVMNSDFEFFKNKQTNNDQN